MVIRGFNGFGVRVVFFLKKLARGFSGFSRLQKCFFRLACRSVHLRPQATVARATTSEKATMAERATTAERATKMAGAMMLGNPVVPFSLFWFKVPL